MTFVLMPRRDPLADGYPAQASIRLEARFNQG